MTQRITLTRQLREMRAGLLELGSLAERAVTRAMQALQTRDRDLAQRVIDDDLGINRLRYTVEEQVVTVMATQQPMAGDLRELLATVSIATELERIADHAKGIAVLTHRLADAPVPPDWAGLPAMGDEARRILRLSLDAYVSHDKALAVAVESQDDAIDHRYQAIFHELIDFMGTDAAARTPATYLLWVAHNLERIADRATNIAERVVFLITGSLVEATSGHEVVG